MSEPQSYPSPNAAQMAAGAAGLYAHPNGNMSPPEASSAVDPHLSLQHEQTLHQELTAQLTRATEAPMGGAQNQQSHGLPMGHHVGQVHTPVQQPSTPQQMAQNAMNMAQDPHYSQQDSNQRKRSKVSRACDECRRKKVGFSSRLPGSAWEGTILTCCRFAVMRLPRTGQRHAPAASAQVPAASLADSR